MFEYTLAAAGPCAVTLGQSAIGVGRPFFDCLVATVHVERGDSSLTAAAAQAVRRIAQDTGAAYIVINGDFHSVDNSGSPFVTIQSDPLSDLADMLDVLRELAERLEEYGERVHLMPFGWQTNSRAQVLEDLGALQVVPQRRRGPISSSSSSQPERPNALTCRWSGYHP
ncbi:hypothetical protein F3087_40055 [Nocardia colli]|uniref:Uncharacterized protein n=1 Tax=Nocardia colli TaxID=2545717 RepID=A0A5N0DXK2_9NOCA|nr:hypothetical protein [Nocardia colli]KAA8881868.1 hypothetical protein F3087_40055 [Nocardia colli]